MSAAEVADRLGLYGVLHRQWHIQTCTAFSGEGLYEGIAWLSNPTNPTSDAAVALPAAEEAMDLRDAPADEEAATPPAVLVTVADASVASSSDDVDDSDER